jgi:hypothetical protein
MYLKEEDLIISTHVAQSDITKKAQLGFKINNYILWCCLLLSCLHLKIVLNL